MKRFTKPLCFVLSLCAAVGLNACGNGNEGYAKANEVKNQIAALMDSALAYEGSFTVNVNASTTESYTQYPLPLPEGEDEPSPDPSLSQTVTTGAKNGLSQAFSYDAESKEYYDVWDSQRISTDAPESDYRNVGFKKGVREEKVYYDYSYSNGNSSYSTTPVFFDAKKYANADYAHYEQNGKTYADYLRGCTPLWINVSDFSVLENVFDELYGADANREIRIDLTNKKGETTLEFYCKGTLAETVGEGEAQTDYVIENEETTTFVLQNDRITRVELQASSSVSAGQLFRTTSTVKDKLSFRYTFDREGYDTLSLAGAPKKDTMSEISYAPLYKNVCNAVGDYRKISQIGYNGLQTTAKQLAELQEAVAENDSASDQGFGTIEGFYCDEAMTKELTESISDAEWKATDTVYVKRAPIENGVYVTEKTTYAYDEDWKWLIGEFDNSDYRFSTAQVTVDFEAVLRVAEQFEFPVEIYVDGEKADETATQATFSTAGAHVVEYRLILQSPKDFTALYFQQ